MDSSSSISRNTLGPGLAHCSQCPYPPFVASAPSLDALPNPRLFFGKLSIEFGVGPSFLTDGFVLVSKITPVVAGPAAQLAPVDLNNPRRKTMKKRPIMGDEEHGPRIIPGPSFQPLDGAKIQVIGGLI